MLVLFATPGGVGLLLWDHMEQPKEREIVRSAAISITASLLIYLILTITSKFWTFLPDFDIRYAIRTSESGPPSLDLDRALEPSSIFAFILANALGVTSAWLISRWDVVTCVSGRSPNPSPPPPPPVWERFAIEHLSDKQIYAIIQTQSNIRVLGIAHDGPSDQIDRDVFILRDPQFADESNTWLEPETQFIAIPSATITHIQFIVLNPAEDNSGDENAEPKPPQPDESNPIDGSNPIGEGVQSQFRKCPEADEAPQTSPAAKEIEQRPEPWSPEND
jgi:hypothetical protein